MPPFAPGPPVSLAHCFSFLLSSFRLLAYLAAAAAKSLQSCLTLCDPIDGSPPGLPVPGILQEEHWSGVPLPSPTFLAVCLLMGFAVCPCRALNWPVSPVRDRSFPSLIYSAQKMCTAFSFSYQLA